MQSEIEHNDLLALTADIVSSHVANNSVSVNDVPQLIQNVFATLSGLTAAPSSDSRRWRPGGP